MLLANKVALVTRAAEGIGFATAKRLAREGAKVIIADVADDAGSKAAAAICSTGAEAIFRSADISQRLDVYNLIADASDTFGRIDLLINNAVDLEAKPFLELQEAEFDEHLQVNLKGLFLISQIVARRMVEQQKQTESPSDTSPSAPRVAAGAIVNVGIAAPLDQRSDDIGTSLTIAGITQLTRSMALSLAAQNIRVNAVIPGTVETSAVAKVAKRDPRRQAALSRTPMGRFADPEEIAAIATWLGSAEASYLTGTTIWADEVSAAWRAADAPPQ